VPGTVGPGIGQRVAWYTVSLAVIPDTPEGSQALANIMFPDLSQVTELFFRPQQGEVMRLSPLVQPER